MSFGRFRHAEKPVATDTDTWFNGRMVFTVDTYLGSVSAPTELVTSVRCVLRCGTQVMLMEDTERRQHVLPGGQIEPGESHGDALQREILEETGYTLANVEQLGACVFRHTTPRPADYRYPYPTFVHLVYRGEADERNSAASERDEHEVVCRFVNWWLDAVSSRDGMRRKSVHCRQHDSAWPRGVALVDVDLGCRFPVSEGLTENAIYHHDR